MQPLKVSGVYPNEKPKFSHDSRNLLVRVPRFIKCGIFIFICQQIITPPSKLFRVYQIGLNLYPLQMRMIRFSSVLVLMAISFQVWAVRDSLPSSIKNRKVITGQFANQNINEIFEIIRVIGRFEMDAMNAYTLRDVLVHEMNAFVIYNPREGHLLNFQGTGQRNIKILLNGVPVLPHSMDIQDIGQFPLNNIERIEIMEGPSSVMYGTRAVSTVINLVSFEFQDKSLQAFARGSLTHAGDMNVDGRLTTRLGPHDLQVFGGRYFFGGLSGIDSGRVMQWKPRSQQFINLQYRYRFYRGLEAFAMLDLYREDTRDKGYPINQSIRAKDHRYLTNRGSVGMGISGKLSKFHNLDAIISMNTYRWQDKVHLIDLSNLETFPSEEIGKRDSFHYRYIFSRVVISRQGAQKIVNYQLGMEYNYQEDALSPVKLGIRPDLTQWALFGAMSWQPTPQFGLKGGLRSMYSNRFRAPITPELKIKYDFTREFSLLVTYANAYRDPTFNELFANGPQNNLPVKGNLNLRTEVSNNFYTSLLFKSNQVRFYTTFFVANRANGIELVPVENDVYSFQNIGNLRYLGNRIALETGNKNYWLKLGLANTGINSLPGQVGNYYFYQEFIAQFHLKIRDQMTISTFNKLQGRREDLRTNNDLETEYSLLTGFILSDISMRWVSSNKRIMLHSGLKNIFNQTIVRETVYLIDENDREILDRTTPASVDYGRRFFLTFNYLIK